MGQHPYGQRIQVRHLCPECGIHTQAFCPVCLGGGLVDTDRLARWERDQASSG
jgi:hypothetical protein